MMKNFSKLINSSEFRRSVILKEMAELDKKKTNCFDCSGPCCTYQKNSMRVTVIEAIDLYRHLKNNNQWSDSLVERLKSNIKEFRLDSHLMLGTRNTFRRTYTCPFFKHESLGCPIPTDKKPYGCLAFNPTHVDSKEGVGCESNQQTLLHRENLYSNELVDNRELKKLLNLTWDKESIPVALLDIDLTYEAVFG